MVGVGGSAVVLVIGVESSQLGSWVFIGLGYHRLCWGARYWERGSKILLSEYLLFPESGCMAIIKNSFAIPSPRAALQHEVGQ